MKTVEKLFIWLIPVVVIFGAKDSVVVLIKDQLLSDISAGKFDFLLGYSLVFSGLLISKWTVINICCAICLYFLSKQNSKTWWTWPIIGLFYGLFSICFYYLIRLQDSASSNTKALEKEISFFSHMLLPLLIIMPVFSFLVYAASVFPLDTLKIPVMFTNSKIASYSVVILTLLPYLPKLVAALWLWKVSKLSTNIRWIWSLFTLFVGLLVPMLFISVKLVEKSSHEYSTN